MTVHFYINGEKSFSWNGYKGELPSVGDSVVIPTLLMRKYKYGHAIVYKRLFDENWVNIYIK